MIAKGYVEILEGWSALEAFAVMDWTASGDSGWIVGAYQTRREAVTAALRHARKFDRELPSADVIPLNRGVHR